MAVLGSLERGMRLLGGGFGLKHGDMGMGSDGGDARPVALGASLGKRD